jgi:hypothetical protein
MKTVKMKIAFAPKKYSVKDSRVISAELKRIQREQSVITPKTVVAIAANKKSPLHKYFEWEDSVAAERYREWQARQLIASIYIVDSGDENAMPIRAFVALRPEEDDADDFMADRGYVNTPSIAGRQSYQLQVLAYARSQLVGWRNRFGAYKEFFGVVKEIDSLK